MVAVDTCVLALGLFLGVQLLPSAAVAQPAPASVQVRFAVAEATLTTESESARKNRMLVSGLGIGLGAATAGVGSVLLGRDATMGGVVVAAQGGLLFLSGVHGLVWRRDPFEELMQDVERMNRTGGTSAVSLHALETRWYELAVRERRRRRVEGALSTAIGGLLFATAAVIAALPGDMDPTLRGLYTRSILGTGIGAVGVGLAKLLIPSAMERSYTAFEGGVKASAFRVLPVAGGASVSFGFTF